MSYLVANDCSLRLGARLFLTNVDLPFQANLEVPPYGESIVGIQVGILQIHIIYP